MLDDSTRSLLRILKWLVLSTVVGLVVGVLDGAFLKLLDVAIGARNTVPCFYVVLPFSLYLVALLSRKVAKAHKDYSTDGKSRCHPYGADRRSWWYSSNPSDAA